MPEQPTYLNDPAFLEPDAGPFLVTDAGATLKIREPSPEQIVARCAAIRATWNRTTERARRIGPGRQERWRAPMFPASIIGIADNEQF